MQILYIIYYFDNCYRECRVSTRIANSASEDASLDEHSTDEDGTRDEGWLEEVPPIQLVKFPFRYEQEEDLSETVTLTCVNPLFINCIFEGRWSVASFGLSVEHIREIDGVRPNCSVLVEADSSTH